MNPNLPDRVITVCLCAGSEFDSNFRFLKPDIVRLGHLGFAQQIAIPAMRRQGTSTILLKDPFGWSRQMVAGQWVPSEFVELDARRLCNDNPNTKAIANILDMNKALAAYIAAGVTIGMYLGSPREPRWAQYTNAQMGMVAAAAVTPFKDSVTFWVMDELAESVNAKDRLGYVADHIEAVADAHCMGETRPLRGKAIRQSGSVVTSDKWISSNREHGDQYHLGVAELPRDYPLYVIEANETLNQMRAIINTGARFGLGLSSTKTTRAILADVVTKDPNKS